MELQEFTDKFKSSRDELMQAHKTLAVAQDRVRTAKGELKDAAASHESAKDDLYKFIVGDLTDEKSKDA